MHRRFTQIMESLEKLAENNSRSASSLYLLAVSGGMDSMCMADLFLNNYGPDSFAVAHCNFALRGEESDGDEKLVREWAERTGVECFVKRFDTAAYARDKGISIEMAARELRYGWFAELCRVKGFSALSVAHNANDNAETLILNLLRGTGIKGLHGMAAVSEIQIQIFRPLLEFTRKQIEGYVFANKVPYREDSTNSTSDYKRNRVRNEVFPIFEKLNPSFVRTLNREMEYFSEVHQIVQQWCEGFRDSIVNPKGNISVSALLKTPHWKYILYHFLQPYGFNSTSLQSLENLLESERTVSGKRFESPTHVLMTARDELVVARREEVSLLPDRQEEAVMVVRGEGIYSFNGVRWKVETVGWDGTQSFKQPKGSLIIDASKLSFPFVCRPWRNGDWFVPFGMKGRKNISDFFADLKYNAFDKEKALMVVDCGAEGMTFQDQGQRVAGVLGERIDDKYKVSAETGSIIRITILNNTETL